MREAVLERKLERYYYNELGKRSSQAMTTMAQSGDLPGCAPVGYRNVENWEGSQVVIDKDKAALVITAFKLAAQGTSFRQIVACMSEKCLVSRRGMPLSLSSLHHLLTNLFYIGLIRYKGKLYKGNHEPLISKTLFDRVQKTLRKRRC